MSVGRSSLQILEPDALVSRSRVAIASPVQRAVVPWLADPPAFIMTRAMLVELERRADGVVFEKPVQSTKVSWPK